MNQKTQYVEANGRHYAWPEKPVVVVCIDGSEPFYEGCDGGGYIEQAIAAGYMPFLAEALKNGTHRVADCVIPSFTNPNNLSIITGAPPSVHGICGNYFYDQDNDAEVLMNDPSLLRVDTIFKAFEKEGADITLITAKDKLRALLGHGLKYGKGGSICFSAEKADQANYEENGIDNVLELVGKPVPEVYSADLSEFIFAAGVKLMESSRPDLMYLSTTDYVQHKHAPGSEGANAFYAMMDGYFQQLDALGVTLALTADHGMKAKHSTDKQPNVLYLQSFMDDCFGEGKARVICPITDPYVVHHGALGGFVTIYLDDPCQTQEVITRLSLLDGIETAVTKEEAARRYELPSDRIGDIVVISKGPMALGTSADRHDLTGLTEPLRTHGGLSEQKVPFLLTSPTPGLTVHKRLRNFDIFDAALNYAVTD